MQTKLTLRLEDELIQRAKAFAKKREKSLSQIVADYFQLLAKAEVKNETAISPTVQSLKGILKDTNISEQDYKDYLENKHL